MSLKKPDELREMQPEERDVRLKELRSELMNEEVLLLWVDNLHLQVE